MRACIVVVLMLLSLSMTQVCVSRNVCTLAAIESIIDSQDTSRSKCDCSLSFMHCFFLLDTYTDTHSLSVCLSLSLTHTHTHTHTHIHTHMRAHTHYRSSCRAGGMVPSLSRARGATPRSRTGCCTTRLQLHVNSALRRLITSAAGA